MRAAQAGKLEDAAGGGNNRGFPHESLASPLQMQTCDPAKGTDCRRHTLVSWRRRLAAAASRAFCWKACWALCRYAVTNALTTVPYSPGLDLQLWLGFRV